MEQATNVFNKGLQLDTHPMVQGNDTLTDCLNGTVVTMQGNEIILQNDMGNRKVDHAYLPSGYQPVGMKEYGGIIYVAAYNPITNLSQIGSFPSPEQIKGDDSTSNSVDIKDLWSLFIDKDNQITFDSKLMELCKDTYIHAGDEFKLYGDLSSLSKELTDYNSNNSNSNNSNNNSEYPKNKNFTLFAGILNSQNEFVDITDSIVKGNNGYFIHNPPSQGGTLDSQGDTTIYSYKLVGPLFLKVQLNHIQTFNYNYYVEKIENNNNTYYLLKIIGTALYNCPTPSKNFFEVINNGTVTKIQDSEEIIQNETLFEDGLYTITVSQEYKIPTSVTIFEGKIEIYAENNESKYPIKNLEENLTIDLSKIGTNTVDLTAWRFYNDIENRVTYFTYGLNLYSNNITVFSDFKIQYKSEGESTYVDVEGISSDVTSGRREFKLDWGNSISEGTVYNVKITYKKDGTTQTINRFFLTTELFNQCYYSNQEDYVVDYVLFQSDFGPGNISDRENNIRTKLLTVDLETDGKPNITIVKGNNISNGQLFYNSGDNNDHNYTIAHTATVTADYSNVKLKIKNKSLYPSYLDISDKTPVFSRFTKSTNITSENAISRVNDYKNQDGNRFDENSLVNLGNVTSENNNKHTFSVTYIDAIYGKLVTEDLTFPTLYVNLSDSPLAKQYIFGSKPFLQSGWVLQWYKGTKLHHYVRLYTNVNNPSESLDPDFQTQSDDSENEPRSRTFTTGEVISESLEEGNKKFYEDVLQNENPFVYLKHPNESKTNNVSFVNSINMDTKNNEYKGFQNITVSGTPSTDARNSFPASGSAGNCHYGYIWMLNTNGELTILENDEQTTDGAEGGMGVFPVSGFQENINISQEDIEDNILKFLGQKKVGGVIEKRYLIPIQNVNAYNVLWLYDRGNYVHNNQYKFDLNLSKSITSNSSLNNQKIGQNNKILYFGLNNFSTTIENVEEFESSEEFQDIVQEMLDRTITNKKIYVDTGETVPYNGLVYYKVAEKEFSKKSNAPIILSDVSKGKLLCTKTSKTSFSRTPVDNDREIITAAFNNGIMLQEIGHVGEDIIYTALIIDNVSVLKKSNLFD